MLSLYSSSEASPYPETTNTYGVSEQSHQHHTSAHVHSMGLILDCIRLAQSKKRHKWAWKPEMAEDHPALIGLCSFWEHYQTSDDVHKPRIPYIQLYLGGNEYLPLIDDGARLPLELDGNEQSTLQDCSVLFGDLFLVSYLAGRHVTFENPHHNELVFYTVNDVPLLSEPLLFGHLSLAGRDSQNDLAFRTLQALYEFPKRYPSLWQHLLLSVERDNA